MHAFLDVLVEHGESADEVDAKAVLVEFCEVVWLEHGVEFLFEDVH